MAQRNSESNTLNQFDPLIVGFLLHGALHPLSPQEIYLKESLSGDAIIHRNPNNKHI